MKIIRKGDLSRLHKSLSRKRFYCYCCGCVFDADIDEYIDKNQSICECPCCHNLARESKGIVWDSSDF